MGRGCFEGGVDSSMEPGRPVWNALFRRSPNGLRLPACSADLFLLKPHQRLRRAHCSSTFMGVTRLLVFCPGPGLFIKSLFAGKSYLRILAPRGLFLLDARGHDDHQLDTLGFPCGGEDSSKSKGGIALLILCLGHAIGGGIPRADLFNRVGRVFSFDMEKPLAALKRSFEMVVGPTRSGWWLSPG